MFRFVSLIFEPTMFALGTDYVPFVVLGVISVALSVVQLIVGLLALARLHREISGADEDGYSSFLRASRYQGFTTSIIGEIRHQIASLTGMGNNNNNNNTQQQQNQSGAANPVEAAGKKVLNLGSMVATSVKSVFSSKPKTSAAPPAAPSSKGPTPKNDSNIVQQHSAPVPPPPSGVVADFCQPGYGGNMKWQRWLVTHKIRRALHRRESRHRKVVILMISLFTVLIFTNIIYEFLKIFTNQPALFDTELNKKYKDEARTRAYFPSRSHNTWKVHLVVVDGLREDFTLPGSSTFGDYVSADPSFAPFSQRFSARAQLPSFSVPNWMSILTGCVPDITGVTGNLANDETTFDHIFRQAKNYGLHAGMTGTPWWKDLVFSTIPPLDGDGTVDASWQPENGPTYSWTTSNPADEERLRIALRAAQRSTVNQPFGPAGPANLYDLFLTHFSDVDAQGHEYGIDVEWNTEDTYRRALINKTLALQQIVNAIDTNTVLIITSDHGHVRRGGHGGVSQVLRDVPLLFYVKNRPLTGGPAATTFPADAEPRLSLGGAYSNLDISSTICALLGIPAPRQTLGIFVEEIIEALVPASVRNVHYHDLYMASRSMVAEYAEMLSGGIFGDSTEDPLLVGQSAANLASRSPTTTSMDYGNAIRDLKPLYESMRDSRSNYSLVISLLCSLVVLAFAFALMMVVFDGEGGANLFLPAPVGDARAAELAACKSANTRANIVSLITVILYIGLSIAIFAIGYFVITGYTVWDSTLTHTTSTASPFIGRTIIGPIIVFLLLTKIYLAPHIDWQLRKMLIDLQSKKPMSCLMFLRWVTYFCRDVYTIFVATEHYREESWPTVYLYLQFMSFWASVLSTILLFLAFPFTYAIPVVLSTAHVTETNLEFRFRIMTMWMIVCPLNVGLLVHFWYFPADDKKKLVAWDNLFVATYLPADILRLEKNGIEEQGIDASTDPADTLRGKHQLLCAARDLLSDPELSVIPEDLTETPIFDVSSGGGASPGRQRELVGSGTRVESFEA